MEKKLPQSKKEIIFISCPNGIKSKLTTHILSENYKYKNIYQISNLIT